MNPARGVQRCIEKLAALGSVLSLVGCAMVPADNGLERVHVELSSREPAAKALPFWRSGVEDARARTFVRERLAKPLTADDAVQIALLNNPGLQALYGEVGIATANLAQAGRLPNPRFTFSRLAGPASLEIERGVSLEVVSFFTRPLLQTLERGRLTHAQLQAALEAVKVGAEARRAYVSAIAAAELAHYAEQAMDAAQAGAELARRMADAGNSPRSAQLREQVFFAETDAQLARARQLALAQRERLVRMLGLNDAAASLHLPDRLPDLPGSPRSLEEAISTAGEGRLDVQVARIAFDNTTSSLRLVRGTRFVSVFEVGYLNKSERDTPRTDGYTLEIQVPLFDWGDAKVAKAEAIYRQAAFRLAETTVNAASELRTTYQAYRTAYDLARRYQDEIVPLRRKISEENLLRYNGMLIGVFELLVDAREQVASITAAIEARRDFWLADADLRLAFTGGSPTLTPLAAPRTDSGGTSSAGGH